MKRSNLATRLELRSLAPEVPPTAVESTGGYVSDLLSDVLANAPKGGVLVTVHVYLNVITVAVRAKLAGVTFALDRLPVETVRAKAMEERLALYPTKSPAFDVAGRLYALSLPGPHA